MIQCIFIHILIFQRFGKTIKFLLSGKKLENLDQNKDVFIAPCGHAFCYKCIEAASDYNTEFSNKCPNCRQVINEKYEERQKQEQQLIYYIFDLINEIEFFMNRIPSPDSNEIQEFHQYLSRLHPSLHIIFDNIVNEPNPTNNI